VVLAAVLGRALVPRHRATATGSAPDDRAVDRHSIDRHSVDRHSIDRDSIDRHSVDRHSVDRHSVDRSAVGLSVATGICDMTANVLFLVANREGLLALVAVITSLYPASTIALAQIFLGERLARHQLVGLALAVVAVVLIAGS
jgi:drug/metabolite transporter (DMT)-like permease